jgi:acyl carrier protein
MDIFEEIKNILAEILDIEAKEVTPESCLIRELGAESIDFLELAAALNARFKIEVNEADVFLRDTRSRLQQAGKAAFPFLTDERRREITANHGAAVLKVKDLVSYVAWQLKKDELVKSYVIS